VAKIRYVEIVNLAGRDDTVTFELNPDLNVFWGLNGSGKTSLLKILHSALLCDASILLRVPFKSAKVRFEDHKGRTYTRSIKSAKKSPDQHEIDLLNQLDSDEATAAERFMLLELSRHWEWKDGPGEKSRIKAFEHRYLPISRMTDLARSPRGVTGREVRGLLNEAQIDEEFARQTLLLWRDYSHRALMEIRRVQSEGIAEILAIVLAGEQSKAEKITSISSADAYELVKSFLRSQRIPSSLGTLSAFSANYESNPAVREIVARIEEIENSIKDAQEPQHRLTNLLSSLFSRNKRLVLDPRSVAVHVGREELPIESLSSGEKQMVRILLECLATENNCILIDEPELSLHVDWQHRLVECMRLVNDDAQIILATHSPEVMAEIPNTKVFEL